MRIAVATLALLAAGCAEYFGGRPTFPRDAAAQPVVDEQALLGFDAAGNAAVLHLVDAEGIVELSLTVLDHEGGATRVIANAPAETASAVAARVRALGARPELAAIAWPDGSAQAAALGFVPHAAAAPVGTRRFAGPAPLSLRVADADDPQGVVLLVADDGRPPQETEATRITLAGAPISPEVWIAGDTVWLSAGSVSTAGGVLRRSTTVVRASLPRAAARLHDARGLDAYARGDYEAARRAFARAVAADPGFADGLYNAAAVAARTGHDTEAVAFLTRAAAADPRRVQVLGRDDPDFSALRRRDDVRALLGLVRLPPEGVPQP